MGSREGRLVWQGSETPGLYSVLQRRILQRRMFHLRLWGLGSRSVCWVVGRRWKTLAGRCPCSCASGAPTIRDKGVGPLLPLLRPVVLYALDLGRDRQGHQFRARLRGVGCTAIGREKGSSSVRMESLAGVIFPSLPVRPGARGPPTPGFIKRTGYREDLGAGPIRPLFRSKERLPPEGGFPCKRLRALRGFHMER